MRKRCVKIYPHDNVATALNDLVSGDIVEIAERDGSSFALQLVESVPFGHKVAIRAIGQGEDIVKYGAPIGVATERISKGGYAHTHNIASKRAKVEPL